LLPKDLAHVFEFRDPSWVADEVLAMLDAAGVGFCTHDFPGLATPSAATGNIAYVRFHGTGGKYWGRYSKNALTGWANWMRAQEAEGRAVWAYFNNDIHGHAIEDATALKRRIAEFPQPA
jgi:uncharacterized protein YecE (DUF72 family)